MAIVNLTKENFNETVEKSELILVDFWAGWCGPCRMLGEVLEEVNRIKPDLLIGKVNVDEQRALAMEYQIRSIPQMFVFKNGKIVKNISGFVSSDDLLKEISEC